MKAQRVIWFSHHENLELVACFIPGEVLSIPRPMGAHETYENVRVEAIEPRGRVTVAREWPAENRLESWSAAMLALHVVATGVHDRLSTNIDVTNRILHAIVAAAESGRAMG
jgi:hypothetical protein